MSETPVPPPPRRHRKHDGADSSSSPMMAGAAHNVVRHLAPTYQEVSSTPNLQEGRSSQKEFSAPRAITPNTLDEGIPETTIGEYVTVKGELEFDRLLRIDGSFEGKLVSEGDLVIGPQGKLTGNVENIKSMLVEGHVIGNINVERLALRGAAFVYGDITCKSLSMEPSVMVSGRLNLHPLAPKAINSDGSVSSSPSTEQVETVQKVTAQPESVQNKQGFYFNNNSQTPAVEKMVVSPDKRTLVPVEASDKQHEEALKLLGEQRTQLEHQITEQKKHAAQARKEEEDKLEALKADAERLRQEEDRHRAEAKKKHEEAALEVARLKEEAAKREVEAANPPSVQTPVDATPPPDIVA